MKMGDSLNVLAFDTTAASCSVAICGGGQILSEEQVILDRNHAEVLVPMIEHVLRESSMSYRDLDLLAVTTGPGAFTGIRVGLATAKGIALATNLPLIGISNFEVLAHSVPQFERKGKNILVLIETKRADFYACIYDEKIELKSKPSVVEPHRLKDFIEIGPTLIIGNARDRGLKIIQEMDKEISCSEYGLDLEAKILAELSIRKFNAGVNYAMPSPFYIKSPDVNTPSTKR